MKLSKKLLSLLLCTVMVLGTVAVGGDGFAEVLDAFSVKASAYNTGDDYPQKYKNYALDAITDEWNFYNRECTSFVAWCLNSRNGVAFNNTYKQSSSGAWDQTHWSNAKNWVAAAQRAGITVNQTPSVGAVACWTSGTYGHVAWVKAVNSNGTVNIDEYNWSVSGGYGSRSNITATYYIHIKDISSSTKPGRVSDLRSNKSTYTTSEQIHFSWSPASGATEYWVYLWQGGKELYYCCVGNNCGHTCSPLGKGDYYLIIRPGNSCGYNEDSNKCYFTVYDPNEKYTVSYNANGGTGAPTSQTKTYDKALSLSTTKPTRTGYTFKNWNTKSDGTGTSYSAGASYTANAAVTLYAQWTANTYTVTYNANGGTGVPANQTKTYGTTLTLSSTKPTRTGYTFKNWNTKSDGTGTSYSAGASYTANAAVTLYAQWTANTYTVTYNANGGTGAPANQTKTYGVTLYLSSVIPTKDGYEFNGWNTKQDGTGDKYSANGSYIKNENITLYAQWVAKHIHNYEWVYNNDATTEADGTETYMCTGCGVKGETRIKPGTKLSSDEPYTTGNAVIKIATAKTFDYRSIVTITATATDVPEGYHLALYVNGAKVKDGDNKSVSYTYGEIKTDINYTVKIVDSNGNVQKDSSDNDLSKDSRVTVNAGFFKKLVAFFKGLFGTLPKVEVKP